MDALKLQDAAMQGAGQYMKWRAQFLAQFQEYLIRGQLRQAFALMPAPLKEQLKQLDPKSYEQVMALLEGE